MKKLLVLTLILSFIAVGCLKKPLNQSFGTTVDDATATVVEQPAVVVVTPAEYQQSLKLALRPYWEEQKITETKEAVLDLTAPVDFLTLHFQAVVALEIIEQGQKDSDQSKIEDGFDRLNNLAQQYSWLK